MIDTLNDDLKKRMSAACDIFMEELKGLRTGRASPQLLEPVMVEAYGEKMPLTQVGSISIVESRLLGIQVWDGGLVKAVDKAIREAGLGLNPSVDGLLVRVPLPELTEDRRRDLVKLAAKYAEGARVAVRGVRRDGMETAKKHEKKNKQFSEDEGKRLSDDIQKLTDSFIKKIDEVLAQKEKDILSI